MSSDNAISKCAFELAGESPSNEPVASSKFVNPRPPSNNSLGFSANWVNEAVTLAVCTAPMSMTLEKS